MATIREVARKAGVSYTTVSHVLNNTRFVSETTRQRVLLAMDELGYQPNALARSLRRGETHTLGLILPDSANPFFAEVSRAIENTAFENGYSVILCNTEGELPRERLYVDVLAQKQVDGIIFFATGDQSDSLRYLLDRGYPVVLVDRELDHVQVDTVTTDNTEGGYLATWHLIQAGYLRIACIAGPAYLAPSNERLNGYRRALAQASLPLDESLVVRGDFHPKSGHAATRLLLNLPEPPQAIFACNDLMAFGALSAARELGRQVPGDLALVGFDDIELATYSSPPLSTVAQAKLEIGTQATRLLIERISDRSLPPRRVILKTQIMARQSSNGLASRATR